MKPPKRLYVHAKGGDGTGWYCAHSKKKDAAKFARPSGDAVFEYMLVVKTIPAKRLLAEWRKDPEYRAAEKRLNARFRKRGKR